MVVDQNINNMVNALATALSMLSINPICDGSVANTEKKAPSI